MIENSQPIPARHQLGSILNDGIPVKAESLIEILDSAVPHAVVTSETDINPFELGKQAGARGLVDCLVQIINKNNHANHQQVQRQGRTHVRGR